MARNDTSIDPAVAVMKQLATMDSKSYSDPDPYEEPAKPFPQAGTREEKAKPSAEKGSPKGRRKEPAGKGGHVQMYIPSDIYAKLKMAKAAHLFATGEDVSAGRFVGLLIDKGLKAVNADTARVFAKLRDEE